MKPTMKEVAHAAGVSLSAVSRAFTPGASLDLEKRKRILAAAQAIGYTSPARRTAEAIAANTVTLVAGDLLNPFYPMVLDSLAKQLQQSGKQLIVYALSSSLNIDAVTDQVLAARPAAVIVTSALLTSNMARACRQHQIKVVLLNRIQQNIKIHSIACDNYRGGQDVARLFLMKERRRIGFIGARMDPRSTRRLQGYRAAMTEAGLFDSRLVTTTTKPSSVTIGTKLFEEAIERVPSLDGIVCNNDDIALGVLFACNRAGIPVPKRLCIIGFNDFEMMDVAYPTITSIRTPRYQIGRTAIAMALQALDGSRPAERVVDLGFELRIRQSTMR